ncbi:NTP transferase domain-containing protein [Pseudoroseomonas wenyumeiae]
MTPLLRHGAGRRPRHPHAAADRGAPKPLLPLAGRTLLDHALDRIDEAGIGNVVVNAHWFPHLIEDVCAARAHPPKVVKEDTLLETGGGIRNALPLLGEDPSWSPMAMPSGWTGRSPPSSASPSASTRKRWTGCC